MYSGMCLFQTSFMHWLPFAQDLFDSNLKILFSMNEGEPTNTRQTVSV